MCSVWHSVDELELSKESWGSHHPFLAVSCDLRAQALSLNLSMLAMPHKVLMGSITTSLSPANLCSMILQHRNRRLVGQGAMSSSILSCHSHPHLRAKVLRMHM